MTLFTKSIQTNEILIPLKSILKIKDFEVKNHPESGNVILISFFYKNINFRLIHHPVISQYSFSGSLIKIELIKNGIDFETDLLVKEEIFNLISSKLGGIVDDNQEIRLFDQYGDQNGRFIVNKLYLHGISDEEIEESIGQKYDEITKEFYEKRNKPSGH